MVVEDILKALDLLTRGARGAKNKSRSFDKKLGLSTREGIKRGVKSGHIPDSKSKLLKAGAGFGVAGYAGAKAIEETKKAVEKYLKDDTPNTAAGIKAEIKKAEGLSKADANKLISILGPEIKEAASVKPTPAGHRPEKELTFGQKFKEERAKAKKAGKELTATFTYKGKSYNTRIDSEEATRKEKASARTRGKGTKAVTITDLAPSKKANRGALVSRQRKGHTDMRKGGLFR